MGMISMIDQEMPLMYLNLPFIILGEGGRLFINHINQPCRINNIH